MEGKLSSYGSTNALISTLSTLKVLQADWEACIAEGSHHKSTTVTSRIALWMKLWDMALDYGPHGTKFSPGPLPRIDKTTVLARHLPPLLDSIGCSIPSSLHTLPYTSQSNQLPYLFLLYAK